MTHHRTRVSRTRPPARSIVLLVLASGAAIALALLLAQSVGINVTWELWYLANKVMGPTRIGIWQEDATFGWVHNANSSGRHRKPLAYDVTYTIDAHGHRVTAGSYDLPEVLILGDSLTFGQGVEDNEAYPALLQEQLPGVKVINGGVSAWGTTQALLKLQQQLQEHDTIRLVVYTVINHNLDRNYLRKSWLEHIDKSRGLRVPYYDVVDGQLVFQGLADPQQDGLEESPELRDKEQTLTRLLLTEMASLCAERSIPFVVVYLPTEDERDFSALLASAVGEAWLVDLRQEIDYATSQLRFDPHPSPEGHRRIAAALGPVLRQLLD